MGSPARYVQSVQPGEMKADLPGDGSLDQVAEELIRLDPTGERVASVIRTTYDQVYDGRRTGRFRWSHLAKVEKTYFGSLIEINLQREFGFNDGERLDFSIAGVEVDCKWSQRDGAWMIPPEAVDQICMLVHASDETSRWKLGLAHCGRTNLRSSANRDAKTTLSLEGRETIRWIWEERFRENILLRMTPEVETAVMSPRSGTERLNALFLAFPHHVIPRSVIETVARQSDALKRVRYNGGSRSALRPHGFVILGGDSKAHRNIAIALGLPTPGRGEFVAARLAPTAHGVGIGDRCWRLATDTDPVVDAPILPNREPLKQGADGAQPK